MDPLGLKRPPNSTTHQSRQYRAKSTSVVPTTSSPQPPFEPESAGPKTLSRRSSLRMPLLHLSSDDVPIPPSLVHSPYLRTGKFHSRNYHAHGVARLPTQEQSAWLQDTVPLRSSSTIGFLKSENDAGSPGSNRYLQIPQEGHTTPIRPYTVAVTRDGEDASENNLLNSLVDSLSIADFSPGGLSRYHPSLALTNGYSLGLSSGRSRSPIDRKHIRNRSDSSNVTRPVIHSNPPSTRRSHLPHSRSMFSGFPQGSPTHYFFDHNSVP